VPLAIELAAARNALHEPRKFVRALRTIQASDRRLAAARWNAINPCVRQVQWSFDLLTPQEQTVLSRASYCREFSLEAAEKVCAGAGRR